MASVELRGIREMQRRIKDISSRMRDNTNRILEAQAEVIVERARELCPYDANSSGPHLRDSIRIDRAQVQQGRAGSGQFTSGSDVEVRVVAGGPEFPYAVAVHENPSLHDPPSWKGKSVHFTTGGPKFLERAFKESLLGLESRLKKILD